MPRANTAVQEYMTSRVNAIETEEAPLIDGTQAVPADIAAAIGDLANVTVSKRKKDTRLTIYDRYDRPSAVSSDRLMMTLTEKDKQGNPYFFAQRRGIHADLVTVQCPVCIKDISENPDLPGFPRKIEDDEDLQWRKDMLLFPHVFKRHSGSIPRIFKDKERRQELLTYTTGPGK